MKIVKCINKSQNPMPEKKNPSDAGMDIRSNEKIILKAGKTKIIKTGLYFDIPHGMELQVRSRSGLASKGIIVTNSPGTIDCGYQGEVGVILSNISDDDFLISIGDRIAQLVVASLTEFILTPIETFDNVSNRGENGFGSSGVK